MPDAPTNGPTPANMPGAATSTPPAGEPDGSTNDPAGDGNTEDDGAELSYEELQAEREKWKSQARKNEDRAKKNAEKAKLLDGEGAEWKKAWEREQAEKNRQKTPEQIKAEADAEADAKVQAAEQRALDAEARSLRRELADGKVPAFAMALIDGTDEEAITEQVASVTKDLEDWYAARLAVETNPRRPLPNPLAGRTNGTGSTPREQFAATFEQLLNP